MLKVKKLTVENQSQDCITDNKTPTFAVVVESDERNVTLRKVTFSLGNWEKTTDGECQVIYSGEALKPYSSYEVKVEVEDQRGNIACEKMTFEMGKLESPWHGQWITDGDYHFKESKISPRTMTFRKQFSVNKTIQKARMYITAFGIYELSLNHQKVGKDYFAPGFTSYKHHLQYQTYDVTEQLSQSNEIIAVVGGGWAVGAFTYKRQNRVYANRQALKCECLISYIDGSQEWIASDDSWQVTLDGQYVETEFYNGEIFDARVHLDQIAWRKAALEKVKLNPQLIAQYGEPVRAHEVFEPLSVSRKGNKLIYDFGQNFAGVIEANIKGHRDQKITFKHAEVLMEGDLFTEPLRTAKQEAIYYCVEGDQTYSPRMTYMGFRYVSVEGIDEADLQLKAIALYSDIEETGDFECSYPLINQLQKSIKWGAKSNFVDIPTDCPQRDERMGWTGDIALFASTAAFNFNTRRFLEKWLKDVKVEQTRGGGIPVTVPLVRVPMQWEIMIPMAVDHWGDACILVPWAEYMTRGDVSILKEMYPTMKKYIKACEFWAGLFSVGKRKHIWKLLHHYGDWVAPESGLWDWMGRGKWTATACLSNSSRILSQIADLLGHQEDASYYQKLSQETADAYRSLLMDQDCRVKKEFQTAYVLPLHYQMLEGKDRQKTAEHLVRMVRENEYHIGTGFPGTPFILFALADNGYVEDAYKMLMTDTCPSWLFEMKAGGTTIWERWDALREDGTSNTGADDGTNGMVSFNHYASGAVGDFLYKRVAGIEPTSGAYKTFKIQPLLGGGLSYAKAFVETGYGRVESSWMINNSTFSIKVKVPVNTECQLILPSGQTHILGSGDYAFEDSL